VGAVVKTIAEIQAAVQLRAAAFVAKHLADKDARTALTYLLTGSLVLELGVEEALARIEHGDIAGAVETLRGAVLAFKTTTG